MAHTTPRATPSPPDTGPPQASENFASYVAWYSWARTGVVRDAVVCHTAAAAAQRALAADGLEAARKVALAAAADEAAVGRTRAGYGARHRYVEWFVWARDTLRLPDATCHQVARGAVDAISEPA